MGIILTCVTLVACLIWGGAYAHVLSKGESNPDMTGNLIVLMSTWFPLCLWAIKKSGERHLIYLRNVAGSFVAACALGLVIAFVETRLGSRGDWQADARNLAQEFMTMSWLSFIGVLGVVTWKMKSTRDSAPKQVADSEHGAVKESSKKSA